MNIVVLAGGTSTERDVSIVTSRMVCQSLRRNGHKANIIDVFLGTDKYKDAHSFFNANNDLQELWFCLQYQEVHFFFLLKNQQRNAAQ